MTESPGLRPVPAAMPALVTPFDAAGVIDESAHEHNVAHLAGRGVTGFLIAGSTGEGPYLLPGERRTLLVAARRAAPGSFLLGGVAAQSVAQATAQLAELDDADAALVVTPTAFVSSVEHQVGYYSAVADAATKPVWLYTVPKVTGYNLPVPAVVALATHGNIVGIKDSSGIPERIGDIRGSCPPGFLIYVGASSALAASRRRGCNGAITASSNYTFSLVDQLVKLDPADAAIDLLQARLTEVAGRVEAYGVPGTKAMATLAGLQAGHPRAPLATLDADSIDGLSKAVTSLL